MNLISESNIRNRKVLAVTYPTITSWTWHANLFAMIERLPEAQDWIFSNHIQLQCRPDTRKEECLQLPKKMYSAIGFSLTKEQEMHYDDVADILLFDLEETKPETIYRLFSGLQAVMSGFKVTFKKSESGYEHIVTIPFFRDPFENPRLKLLLNIIDDTEKVIIFCKYKDEITTVCEVLNSLYGSGKAVRFDGAISNKERTKNLSLFKSKAVFLVANRGCAGYSLNLQFCRKIIYFSNDWNLATRLQSEDRIHRNGQKNNVEIIDMYAFNTLDERILSCLQKKQYLAESFKCELKKMSNKQQIKNWLKIECNQSVYNDILELH